MSYPITTFVFAVVAMFLHHGHCAIPDSRAQKQNRDEQFSPAQQPPHLTGAPIPTGQKAHTIKDFEKGDLEWSIRIMLGEYKKTADADAAVAAFIEEAI